MRLKPGASVCIGRKTWTREIPDKVFASISEEWTSEQKASFRKDFEEVLPVKPVAAPSVDTSAGSKGHKKEK